MAGGSGNRQASMLAEQGDARFLGCIGGDVEACEIVNRIRLKALDSPIIAQRWEEVRIIEVVNVGNGEPQCVFA
jgi:hypothetical protein